MSLSPLSLSQPANPWRPLTSGGWIRGPSANALLFPGRAHALEAGLIKLLAARVGETTSGIRCAVGVVRRVTPAILGHNSLRGVCCWACHRPDGHAPAPLAACKRGRVIQPSCT